MSFAAMMVTSTWSAIRTESGCAQRRIGLSDADRSRGHDAAAALAVTTSSLYRPTGSIARGWLSGQEMGVKFCAQGRTSGHEWRTP